MQEWQALDALPEQAGALCKPGTEDLAYIQYTSGGTRFPRGVMIDQATILHNLGLIICHGVQVRRGDRCLSWVPFYHDMGLVGMMLAPLACQLPVDYLKTRDFAMRPRLWMELMTRTRAARSQLRGLRSSAARARGAGPRPSGPQATRAAGGSDPALAATRLDKGYRWIW